jgi:hypothetical protein
LMTISETTLSEIICSIVPGKRLRMLVLMTLWGYLNLSRASGGRKRTSPFFELALVLVRLDHVAGLTRCSWSAGLRREAAPRYTRQNEGRLLCHL